MDQDERNALSRRRVVGGLGIGMAVAAAGPAHAQEQRKPSDHNSEPIMDDPRSKYPKPPFKKQT
ncbi:MAG TPA: hypothetical protein VGL50_04500, partial [Steroidobacteraceae bacterium]